MTHSESIAALAAALAAAQGELAPVAFDRDNPFFHSRYATLTALREAMRPVFAGHGLSVIQGAGPDGGIETTILHSSGEWLTSAGLPMKPAKDDPQGIGSLITYARRYGLAAACGLVADEDDDGNRATHGKAPENPQDASTPRSDARHSEPANPVNAEGLCVNAGASRVKGADVVLTGSLSCAPEPREIMVKGSPQEIVEFNVMVEDMGEVRVTAWHEARDYMMSGETGIGAILEIHGRWDEYKGRWKVNANSILPGLPF